LRLSHTNSSLTHPLSVPPPFSFSCYRHLRHLHSFPTRRSSDLVPGACGRNRALGDRSPSRRGGGRRTPPVARLRSVLAGSKHAGDRKSTRLNSSHVKISYAVFCLKKKKINKQNRANYTIAT